MYLETVGIEVVVATIFLGVLVAPSIEWVVGPIERVFVELLHLPSAIVLTLGFLGGHHTTQILTEIGSRAQLMVYTTVVEHKGLGLQ
jgi:hypothetical protein